MRLLLCYGARDIRLWNNFPWLKLLNVPELSISILIDVFETQYTKLNQYLERKFYAL